MISLRFFAVLALIHAGELAAQSTSGLPVALGSRVRVSVPDSARQEAFTPRIQMIRGEVVGVTTDTLSLEVAGVGSVLAVPRSSIRRLDVSRGVPGRPASAAAGALGGALLGAFYGFASRQLGVEEWEGNSVGQSLALGAAIGAAGGLIVGALSPIERWRRVALP